MPLPESSLIQAVRIVDKYKYWMILAVFLSSISSLDQSGGTPPIQKTAQKTSSSSNNSFPNYPPVLIRQGVHQRFTYEEEIAPFRIVTPDGPENYFVKIVNVFTGLPVMSIFIYGGQSFETQVPLGTYRVKYATGKVWYGVDHLFGKNTSYSEADETFEFSVQGNQISGYTIELIRQRHGNLRTKSISDNQF